MEVTPDFKNTEIGCFPRDWNLIELSKISAFITKGSTPTTYGFNWESSGILFLRSECVSEDGMDLNQSKFISIKAHQALKRSEIKNGDILVTITGNVGRAIIYELDEEANINQHIARIRVSSDFVDKSYVYHFLSQQESISRFNSITTGQAYPQLSLKQVRDNLIATPKDVNEQKAIAEALSDADALIESLEKLIEKKRQIKQGAMQELLTGKKRLQGFSGEWKQKLLKTVLKFQVGFPFSSLFFNESSQGIRLVKNRDLKNDEQVFHYSGKYAEEFLVKNGDVLIGMDGDFVPCLWAKGSALLNQRVGRILPLQKLDLKFAFYFLIEPLKAIENATSATTVKHLSHSDIEGIIAPLPEIEEQIAIAQILSEMDNELAKLEEKFSKARQIKQGMMQELLTGRIRLV